MDQERFKNLLKKKKLKVTSQRLLVLEIMAAHPGEHLTAEEIYALARKTYPDIGIATIYRSVQILQELHIIDKVSFGDGSARYELGEEDSCEDKPHHHHAICRDCGRIWSFEDDLLDAVEKALFERKGFQVLDHDVKFYGCCRECWNYNKNKKQQSKQEDKF